MYEGMLSNHKAVESTVRIGIISQCVGKNIKVISIFELLHKCSTDMKKMLNTSVGKLTLGYLNDSIDLGEVCHLLKK